MSTRYILLNPADIHQRGDEILCGYVWLPVLPIHFGDKVGHDSHPCRRKFRRLRKALGMKQRSK
jgi:hypothetical protein